MAKNEPKYKPKTKTKTETKPETKPETKTLVLDCPDCESNREFIYSGYFTMAGGKEAHVRSCVVCGFKRHFTPEGIPFGKTRNREVLQDVPSSKELNRLYRERYPRYVPKITPQKASKPFLVKPRALIASKKASNSNYSVSNFLRTWDMKSGMLVKVGTGGST